jgi:hypothetical protein
MSEPPTRLYRAGRRSIGLAEGGLWTIDVGTAPTRLPGEPLPPDGEIVRAPGPNAGDSGTVLIRSRARGLGWLTRATIGGGIQSRTPFPSPTAELVEIEPDQNGFAFTDATPTGLVLWTRNATDGAPIERLRLNEHVASIDQGRRILFSYRGADGDSLLGRRCCRPDTRKAAAIPRWSGSTPGSRSETP